MSKELKITFQPSKKSVYVLPGTSLLEAAARAGIILDTPCGGAGKCGKCTVRIADEDCLACQHKAETELTVEIPETSLFKHEHQILLSDKTESASEDSGQSYGLAFDIGTTTIAGSLIELHSGKTIAVHGAINPQTSYGDDIVSRIKKCREEENGLEVLQKAVVERINTITEDLLRDANTDKDKIEKAALAGNTAMQQIACNIDSSGLGEIPFEPAFKDSLLVSAEDIGLDINPEAEIYIFPQIGGFVGGDTVAGILETDLDKSSEIILFIDIGTNGEIVLCNKGKLVAASTAAGPAFEGARIINGMRATSGAIEKVVIDDDIQLNVIGNTKPSGLCGSGLIDAISNLLKIGVIDYTGRILSADELPNAPELIKKRIIKNGEENAFALTEDQSVCIYQKDVRELQLAKGAISAGINILLQTENIKPNDLDAILLAGGFGNYIRRSSAKGIGLLPDIESEKIRFVGNTASEGAKHVLLSPEERNRANDIRNKTEHIDLSKNSSFHDEFSSAMLFPE